MQKMKARYMRALSVIFQSMTMFTQLKEDIQSIIERDPAARHLFEVLTTYPGVWAIIFHRLSHAVWQRGFKWFARWISTWSRWLTGIEIHPAAKIGKRFFIDHGMGIVIGETAEIGDDCTMYHGVTLGGTSANAGKRHPTLGNNVVVGAGAKVLGPFIVHDGARIGSNSVVLKEVPAGATVVGIPGRIILAEQPVSYKTDTQQEIAHKLFDAYGMTADMPDPEAKAINLLIDHVQKLDSVLLSLMQQLDKQGIKSDIELPALQPCGLNVQTQPNTTPDYHI